MATTRSTLTRLALVGALAAGGAYAYWTNSGSGTGSATTANPAGNLLTVTGVGAIANLSPGSTAQAVTGTINNGTGAAVTVGTSCASFAGTTRQSGCSASDYRIDGAPILGAAVSIAAAGNAAIPAGITVEMLNTGSNQDACKGQALTVTVSVS